MNFLKGLGGLFFGGALLDGAATLYAGVRGSKEAKRQAKAAEAQARRDAEIRRRETDRVKARQIAAFAAGGIALEDAQIAVIDETETIGAADISAILDFGSQTASARRRTSQDSLIGAGLGFGGSLFDGFLGAERLNEGKD